MPKFTFEINKNDDFNSLLVKLIDSTNEEIIGHIKSVNICYDHNNANFEIEFPNIINFLNPSLIPFNNLLAFYKIGRWANVLKHQYGFKIKWSD